MANKIVKLGDFEVKDGAPVYLIAEIGINHNGDINIAKKLLDAAHACGWHCGKFQKRNPDVCVPEKQKTVMRSTPWGEMTYLEYKKRVEFNDEEYDEIDQCCKMKPMHWTASPWDHDSLNFLLKYDVPFLKVASASLTDHSLIKECALSGKPVILSTGMSTIDEIDEAVSILDNYSNGNFMLMHTNSAYPAPINELNLKVIPFLKERYDCLVGYSGHEKGLEPTVVAVALGASFVERHITLDHQMWGTDHASSLEVHAMDMLRKRIEGVPLMLGDGIKIVTETETAVRKKLRNS
jgi:N-acetylneuraminate synthase